MSEHPEIERKFEVDQHTVIPDLRGVDAISALGEAQTTRLRAAYLDTDRLDLARHHMTLRRREGGSDAGWHLKMESGADDERVEHRSPPDTSDSPPDALLDLVRAVVRDRPLRLVARVNTTRTETPLLDSAGNVLAVFCDDEVDAQAFTVDAFTPVDEDDPTPGDPVPGPVMRWREWEIELVDGDRSVLTAAARAVVAGGAHPAASSSKLARTLGDRLTSTVGPPHGSRAGLSTSDLLRLRLRRQVLFLEKEDRRLRTGESTAVHQMRTGTRRLRSALASFAPVLEPGSTDSLREGLRWLGGTLGTARDAEVLHARLLAELADLAPEEIVGPVGERIDRSFEADYAEARGVTLQALASSRYYRLLDDLETFARELPVRASGGRRATKVVPKLVRRDTHRFTRATKRVVHEHDPSARADALHEARKKAKRLRYLAESIVPVYGKRAKKALTRVKRVQEALGAHQDAVMALERLAALAAEAREAGEATETYERLRELETASAARAERRYDKVLPRLYRGAIRHLSQH